MSETDCYGSRYSRTQWHGVDCFMYRTVPLWDETKVIVRVEVSGWRLPGTPASLIEWLATLPAAADLSFSDQSEENPGVLDICWTGDATPEDIAAYKAEQEAARREAADREAFEAWKVSQGLSS